MEKTTKIFFTDQGPFSKLNKFTTLPRMILVETLLGTRSDIRTAEPQEYSKGVKEYDKIAE
jgi:hypothetical protein